MKQILENILNRRSQRTMEYEPIPQADLDLISEVMNSAPTSSNKFDATALIITDQEIKEEMFRRLNSPSQAYYKTSGAIIVFFADMNRGEIAVKIAGDHLGGNHAKLNTYDNLLNSWGDAYIMSQNAVIAAEALDYGTIYLGGIRHFDFPWLLRERFNLPENVFPVIAIAIGKRGPTLPLRPRLNRVYTNEYSVAKIQKEITAFDEEEKKYMKENFGRDQNWTSVIAKYYTVDSTPIYGEYIKPIFDIDKYKNEAKKEKTE